MQVTGRKGFLLPELTDDNPTPGAVIREAFRTNAGLSDESTFYTDNEQITGKWEFVEAILADKGEAVPLLNNSGGARVSGDVVMLDPAVDQAFILPNAAQVDASKILIVAEAIAGGAVGHCTLLGITRVKAAAGTVRGRYLQTQNGSVIALGNTNITPGSFGYSLTAVDGTGTVLAAIHAGGAGGGLEVSEVDAFPDVIGARQIIFPNGSVTDLGAQVVQVTFGSSIIRREQYTVTGTTQALGLVPDVLLGVRKNGLGQAIGTDVTLAGQTLTFSTALAADVIEVIYMVTNSFNPSSAPYVQEFDPAAGGTYVDLANVPTTIMMVARNGVPQSQSKGDWSWTAGTSRVTFSDAFVTGDHLIITFAQNFGGGNASSVNGLPAVPASAPAPNSLVATDANGRLPASTMPTTTGYHEEFLPANGATTVVLSTAPGLVLGVFRDGVIQSLADGHYTLAGSTLTFVDAFDGTNRVVVNYVQGTSIGAASTVGGFSASGYAVATPGTLVATDSTTGKLPPSILSPFQNQFINGGFELWQRGNGPFTSNLGPDKWNVSPFSGSTMSVSRDTANVDTGSRYCAAVTYTHSTSSQLYQTGTEPELVNQIRGRTISASVRVKTSTANAVRLTIWDGGVGSYTYGNYHTGDGTWQTLRITRAISAAAADASVRISFEASCTAYVDNAMYIIGPIAVDFLPMSPADELMRGQRYYEIIGESSTGFSWSSYQAAGTNSDLWVPYKSRKPASPTVTKVGTWTVGNCGQPSVVAAGIDGAAIRVSVTALGPFSILNAGASNITSEANP